MFARSLKIFQPTRPLRGATIMQPDKSKRVWISTHAPLAGRDMPCWLWGSRTKDISTHAPLAGRDKCHSGRRESRLQISTHAPLAGRDASQPRRPYLRRHFNPRAPCGARQWVVTAEEQMYGISTHAPLAGRDSKSVQITMHIFAITDKFQMLLHRMPPVRAFCSFLMQENHADFGCEPPK